MGIILEAQHACSAIPTGISNYTVQTIRHLLKRRVYDYELTFFDKDGERNNRRRIDEYFGEYNVPVHECNSLDYRVAWSDASIFKEKSYNDYTGVYGDGFHFFHLISIPDNLKGSAVVTIHDVIPLMYPELCSSEVNELFRLGLRRVHRLQPWIITASLSAREDILNFTNIPSEKIFAVPLACDEYVLIDRNASLSLTSTDIEFPYLLYLGAISKRKNIEGIWKAFESITERLPDVKLVFAGGIDNDVANVISCIDNSKFRSRVIMLGYVSDEQKYALFSGATAFIFPSLYEGFGLPVLEAMACGCPVITSTVSSLPEVAGDAAILIDPYNVEQLAFEMERIITSESLRKKLSRKGLKRSQQFSWDKTAELVEQVYKISFEM